MTAREREQLRQLIDQKVRLLKLEGICPVCVEGHVEEGRMYCSRSCAADAKRRLQPLKPKPVTGWGAKIWAKDDGQILDATADAVAVVEGATG